MEFVCLAYHRIAADPVARNDPYTITPECFRDQMVWLVQNGYKGVSLSTALAEKENERHATRLIALTFDDGYLDFYTTAWPILKEFDFGATLFIVTERVGKTADWPDANDAPLMGWESLAHLADVGFEIGIHGNQHQPFDSLPAEELRANLATAHETVIQQLRRVPAGLAYPYGNWSEEAATVVQEMGFQWAATARGGVNQAQTSAFKLRRTLIKRWGGGHFNLLRFAVSAQTGYAKLVEWQMDLWHVS